MSRPLTIVLMMYVLGIVLGYFEFLPVQVPAILGLAALALGISGAIKSPAHNRLYFYLFTLALGVVLFQWHTECNRGNVDFLAGCPATITGTVCEEPDVRLNSVNYVIKIENIKVLEKVAGRIPDKPKGRVLLTISGPGEGYTYGDRLQIMATPVRPKEPGQLGEFNYRRYLQARGIQLTAKSWQGAGVQKVGYGGTNVFVNACILLKEKLMSVTRATLTPRHAGLLQGVLFGSAGMIDNQTRNDFALAGVVHILSVSGYHVALLVAICLFLINGFQINRKAGIAFTAIVTLGYTVMSGAGPPAVRSMFMGWTLLLANYLKREYDWISSLSLAALIILLINPNYLADAGFQLSFAATWGVLYLTPQIAKLARLLSSPAGNNDHKLPQVPPYSVKKSGFWTWLGQSIGITVAAQLAVFPITSYYFNYLSVVAVPANLIIVPLTTFAMLLGGLAAIIGVVWLPIAGAVNVSTGFIIELILRMTHWLAGLPFATITVKQPAVIEIVCFYMFLFFVTAVLQNPALSLRIRRMYLINYRRLVPLGMAVIVCLLWVNIASSGTKGLELTFLDIGQGDAAVIEAPGGFTTVIDTGGAQNMGKSSYNPGEKILMPFLRRKGISRIDVLLLSHAHADHIQGAEFLVNNIQVRMLITDEQFRATEEGVRLVRAFQAKGTKIREVSGGDRVWFDEKTTLEVLSPLDKVITDPNNDSLVVRLGYGEFHVLFTGDAGVEALEKMHNTGKLHAEIVKIPHHGSKNNWSEEFYRSVNPETAVISVGPNYFGHPSSQVLNGLSRLGVSCYRTDRSGAVTITSDGNHYRLRTGRKSLNQAGY